MAELHAYGNKDCEVYLDASVLAYLSVWFVTPQCCRSSRVVDSTTGISNNGCDIRSEASEACPNFASDDHDQESRCLPATRVCSRKHPTVGTQFVLSAHLLHHARLTRSPLPWRHCPAQGCQPIPPRTLHFLSRALDPTIAVPGRPGTDFSSAFPVEADADDIFFVELWPRRWPCAACELLLEAPEGPRGSEGWRRNQGSVLRRQERVGCPACRDHLRDLPPWVHHRLPECVAILFKYGPQY